MSVPLGSEGWHGYVKSVSLRWHDPDQVRRSKVDDLPLSPAYRTPVCATAYYFHVTDLTDITPEAYGVGARFTLSVYDSDYVRIFL